MSRAHCLSLLVTMIVVLLLLMSLEVQAQSTVDYDDSCQSTYTTLDETVTARNVQLMKEDLTEIKNLLGSRHQPTQCGAVDSSSLCECERHSTPKTFYTSQNKFLATPLWHNSKIT